METASSILRHTFTLLNCSNYETPRKTRALLSSFLSSSSSSSRNFTFRHINRRIPQIVRSSSTPGLRESSPSQALAVLLEVEGVLVDIYRSGNRQAFNVAFQKLGLDCANWTDPIYLDLARKAGGDERMMLILFFNRIGWPTSLPTNEKEAFVKSVLQEKRNALDEYVTTKGVSLQPGVENFIDDALNEGIPVVLLIAYGRNGEKIARSVIEKLGKERISKIKIVGKKETEESFYGQLERGIGTSSSLGEQLIQEARKAASIEKRRIAEQVASVLKLSVEIGTIETESLEDIVTTLRAGAEYAGLPVQDCVLITGNQYGVLGAQVIGMLSLVLRNSITARTEFPATSAIMDGFGAPDLTISKLRRKRS